MSARLGPQPRRRTSGISRNARGRVFPHEYCTINHRSPEAAARCAKSAPVRARREAAERRAAEIAAARAARAAAASAARAARAADKAAAKARRERQREVRAAGGTQLIGGEQRPHRWALFAAVLAVIVVIGLVFAALGAHHGPGTSVAQQRTSRTAALSAKAHQTSGGRPRSRPSGQSHHAPARPLAAGCRAGNPLANVYHEDRLEVRNRCLTVTGTVAYVAHEDDGDIHVNLSLLPSEAHLLNEANVADQYGQLVTEIVPADGPGCTPGRPPRPAHGSYNYGVCTGADITAPPVGARVAVTGPYVLDADHGWMEIHPIWAIRVISGPPVSRTPAVSPATAPPATPSPPPAPPTTAPSAAWCTASASAANDGYPDDDVHVTSNQPDKEATASDGAHSWSDETGSSGSVTILLFDTPAGSTITVTVGAASCSTTAT
jgi:hypothetical protein